MTEQLRLSGGGRLEYVLDMGDGVTAVPFGSLQLGLMVTYSSPGVFGTLGLGVDLLGIGNWTLGIGDGSGSRWRWVAVNLRQGAGGAAVLSGSAPDVNEQPWFTPSGAQVGCQTGGAMWL